MTHADELALARAVAAAREILVLKLGRKPSRNLEETAARSKDPAVQRALREYRKAIRLMWEALIAAGVPQRLAYGWMESRRRKRIGGLTTGEILSEVYISIRRHVVAYPPDASARFITYARKGVFADLDALAAQAVAPVTVPRAERRAIAKSERPTTCRASLAEAFPGDDTLEEGGVDA